MPGEVEREKWASKTEFILSCIGMSVGLGNVWRFPYVVFENGGGAFMVPYMILMLIVGRPMYYLELVLGQFASGAQARSFGGFPLALGVGWAMVYACAFISLYYNVILGYALLYLSYSFNNVLPWQSCDYSTWANENCYNPMLGVVPCRAIEGKLWRQHEGVNYTGPDSYVIRHDEKALLVPEEEYYKLANSCTNANHTAPEQFFYRHVLNVSSGIEELGSIQVPLSVSLVVSWLCVYMSVFKGIKTSGKVVYVTALVPFLILGGMFLRGITLPGAGTGIHYYLVPKWSKILQTKVWKNAAEQIFYSLSLAEGMIICFGGFNEFRNQLHVDVIVVAVADFVVSVLGGMVVFSVLGNMAYSLKLPIQDVVSSGIGLAFIAYPQAITMLSYPNAWAAAFYAMLFFLAIDTEFASVECLLTPFKDEFPVLRSHGSLLSFIVCLLMCVCGMPMASRGGLYILTLMDTYLGGYLLPWIGLAELLVVLLGYGLKRFCADVEFMSGTQPNLALKFCWAVCCPVCLTWIAIADVFLQSEPLMLGEYRFPTWSTTLGLFSVTVALQIMAGFAIYHWYRCGWDLRKALLPAPKWGPKDPVEYREYVRFLQQRGMHPLSEQDELLIPDAASPPDAPSPPAKPELQLAVEAPPLAAAAAAPGPASPPAVEAKPDAPVPAAKVAAAAPPPLSP